MHRDVAELRLIYDDGSRLQLMGLQQKRCQANKTKCSVRKLRSIEDIFTASLTPPQDDLLFITLLGFQNEVIKVRRDQTDCFHNLIVVRFEEVWVNHFFYDAGRSLYICMLMFVLLFVLSLQMFNHLIMTKQMTTTTQIPTAVVFFCLPMGFFMGIIHYLYSIETMIKDIMHRKEEIEA